MNYYSKKKNVKNKDIYIIDIGGNIGWHTIALGKFGYKIITFEASEINFYILKKNYCLNKDIYTTIINKGLFNEEKKCEYYKLYDNQGNGWVVCDNKTNLPKDLTKT